MTAASIGVGLALLLGLLAVAWLSWRSATPLTGAGPPQRALLRVTAGPRAGSELPIASEITTLGSAEDNTVVLADPAIARRHAAIRMDVVGYLLADLGAPSGVRVNGIRVGKRMLVAGDVIRIGASELMFHLEKVG